MPLPAPTPGAAKAYELGASDTAAVDAAGRTCAPKVPVPEAGCGVAGAAGIWEALLGGDGDPAFSFAA